MRNIHNLILWPLKRISMRFLYLHNQTLEKLSGWYYQKSVSFLANYKHPKPFFTKKEKIGRQVLKNVY